VEFADNFLNKMKSKNSLFIFTNHNVNKKVQFLIF